MKRELFLFYIIFLMINKSLAAENHITLGYCTKTIRPFSVGAMAEVEAVVKIPKEIAKKYAGQHLTQIQIGTGSNSAMNTKVVIRTDLGGDPVYIQSADFTLAAWNTITLNTPYEIKGDEDFYFGYSLTTDIYGQDYALGIDDSPVAHADGDWVKCKLSGSNTAYWMHIGEQGLPNLCIMGIVEGDHPQRDVVLCSLSAPVAAIDVHESFSVNGIIQNVAMKPVNSLDVSYKIGDSEKVIRSFTGLDIPSDGRFDFRLSGIDFQKESNRSYSVEISVEKINGAEDEYPEDNTQQINIRVWNAPDHPAMVSEQKLKKNAILEEFTGVNCTYCPEGHRFANEIQENNQGRVAIINIHQGAFANTNPNYKTPWGDAIADQTGIDAIGYPSGTINRHVFSGNNTILRRTNFSPRTKTVLGQDSYVNVALKTTVNEDTRELSAEVELYYTENGSPVNMLNIALLQDDILGPQIGAEEYYPEMMVDDQYRHNHMLRDLLTGQWGDSIHQTKAGTFIAKKYIYTIPEQIGVVPVDLKKIEIVAFVAEGTQEIISGTSSKFSGIIYTDMRYPETTDIQAYIYDGEIFIHSDIPVRNAVVYALSGQKILSETTVNNRFSIKSLPSGLYIVKLQTGKGEKTIKVIR
jgi:hypothetical protein